MIGCSLRRDRWSHQKTHWNFSPGSDFTAKWLGPTHTDDDMIQSEPELIDIYTDGACSGNPGPGGWGALLRLGDVEKEFCGGEADTTNNRMEVTAAIRALQALKRPVRARLHTDSIYLRDGITKWIHKWKSNGWKTAARKPVKNVDLWQELEAALEPHEIEWHWVKGHAGHPDNERADELARQGLEKARFESSSN